MAQHVPVVVPPGKFLQGHQAALVQLHLAVQGQQGGEDVGKSEAGVDAAPQGGAVAELDAYNVAQEHSCIHDFWNKHHPDVLVMIDATLPAIRKRRLVYWGEDRLAVQHKRLADARAHADLYIQTDALDADAVREKVIAFLGKR